MGLRGKLGAATLSAAGIPSPISYETNQRHVGIAWYSMVEQFLFSPLHVKNTPVETSESRNHDLVKFGIGSVPFGAQSWGYFILISFYNGEVSNFRPFLVL